MFYEIRGSKIVVPLPIFCIAFLFYGGIILFSAVTHVYGLTVGCMAALGFAVADAVFVMMIKSRYGWKEIVFKSRM